MSYRALFSIHVQRVVFKLDPRKQVGATLDSFLKKHFQDYVTLNPKFSFMVRAYEDVEPVIEAYYYPTEDKQEILYTYNVAGMSEDQIEQLLRKIALHGKQRTEQYNNNFASRLQFRDIVHKE